MTSLSSSELQIDVAVQQDEHLDVPIAESTWQQWVAHWLADLRPTYSPIQAYELTLYLTTDRNIQQLNRDYRDRDQPTDVLSFATIDELADTPAIVWESEPFHLGDLIISTETAARQAVERDHALIYELAWLAAHGLLHLLGWDHPDDESLATMLAEQERLLALVGVGLQSA